MNEPVQENKSEQSGEAEKGGRTVQDRINQLVRQKREAERASSDLETQVAARDQQLLALSEKVSQLEKAQSPAPQPKAGFEALGLDSGRDNLTAGHASPAPSAGVTKEELKEVVAEVLNPHLEAASASAQAQRLYLEQKEVFDSAKKDLPGVGDEGTEATELFNQVWNAFPEIHDRAEAPALVINVVRGVLGGGVRGAEKTIEQRKIAASSTQPGANRLEDLPSESSKRKERLDALVEKGKSTPLDDSEMEEFLALKLTQHVK